MSKKHYCIAFDKTDTIWGIGNSTESVLLDVSESQYFEFADSESLLILPCDKILYDEVSRNGYCHGDRSAYWHFNNQTQLAELIVEEKPGSIYKRFKMDHKRKHSLCSSPERNFDDGPSFHMCNDCDKTFIGHKSRKICKLCENKRISDTSTKEFRNLLRSISRRSEFLTIINNGCFTKLLDGSFELNEDSLKVHLEDLYQFNTLVYLLGEELPKLMTILSCMPKK